MLRLLRRALRLVAVLAALWALPVLAAWAAESLWPGRLWPATLAMLLLPWLLLPAVAGLAAALAGGARAAGLVLALAAGVFVLRYGELFWPRPAAAEVPRQLRVVTWNVGPHSEPHPELAAAIRALDADVVALQELDRAEAAYLDAELAADYPTRILQPWDAPGGTGKALLSRRPVVAHDTVIVADRHRPHLRAVVDVDGTAVTVLNAHPYPPPDLPGVRGDGTFREHPVTNGDLAVLAVMATRAAPAVLVGDLNSTPDSTAVRALRQSGLKDAFQGAGFGLGATWPALVPGTERAWPLPLIRIDYVWHTPDVAATRAWAAPAVGTDHRPVVVDLAW